MSNPSDSLPRGARPWRLFLAVGLAGILGLGSCSDVALPQKGSKPVSQNTETQNNEGKKNESTPAAPAADATQGKKDMTPSEVPPAGREIATFGAGCFWCVEAVLQQLDGVDKVESGYTGGTVENPTYKQICTGTTGHAEVVRVTFDPAKISYEKLLVWFFKLHDPTTLNRQGADVGTQYRSAIFYHSEAQKAAADAMIAKLTEARAFPGPIVTEVTAAPKYYPAEGYHQNFYFDNKEHGYCRAVIWPKLDKLGLDK